MVCQGKITRLGHYSACRGPQDRVYPSPTSPIRARRVHGASMLPTLRAGDRLLVRYAAPVPAGRLVLARFADGTLAVKRAAEPRKTRSDDAGWWLLSDNPDEGVDSSPRRGRRRRPDGGRRGAPVAEAAPGQQAVTLRLSIDRETGGAVVLAVPQ